VVLFTIKRRLKVGKHNALLGNITPGHSWPTGSKLYGMCVYARVSACIYIFVCMIVFVLAIYVHVLCVCVERERERQRETFRKFRCRVEGTEPRERDRKGDKGGVGGDGARFLCWAARSAAAPRYACCAYRH